MFMRHGYWHSSDESMNSTSVTTNDSMYQDKGSLSNSDQDVPIWDTRAPHHKGLPPSASGKASIPNRPAPPRNKQPPWLEKVKMTPDVMYRYRIPTVDLSEVLQKDLEAMKIFGKVRATSLPIFFLLNTHFIMND